MRDPQETFRPADLGIDAAEVEFIVDGLQQWSGPARPEPRSAQLAGYDRPEAMAEGIRQIRTALASGAPLSRRDWGRVLIATELIFGSDAFGAGADWEVVTGRDESADLRLLRGLQRKLVEVCPR